MVADEGYYFGLGAFETIAVEDGIPVFLEQHLQRLKKAMKFFSISYDQRKIEEDIQETLKQEKLQKGRMALKVTISKDNAIITTRKNIYVNQQYEQGFTLQYSSIRRNETSPFTYYKTLNYGDCILEKRRAKEEGFDEPVFLNTKGEIAEGATTNVFFVKDQRIIAPFLRCGMLPGIMRQYIYQHYPVEERIIYPEDVLQFDEMFVTNSLLGIMPVKTIGSHAFSSMKIGREFLQEYRNFLQ